MDDMQSEVPQETLLIDNVAICKQMSVLFCLFDYFSNLVRVCVCVCVCVSCSVAPDSLESRSLWPSQLLSPWNSPGKNTGVGCHSLFQWIFQTQRSNPSLPHCWQSLYHLSHDGSTI